MLSYIYSWIYPEPQEIKIKYPEISFSRSLISETDLLKVNLNTTNLNTFDSSSSKTQVNELMVDFTIPIKLNEKTSLIYGLIYENIKTKFGFRNFM